MKINCLSMFVYNEIHISFYQVTVLLQRVECIQTETISTTEVPLNEYFSDIQLIQSQWEEFLNDWF